MGSLTALQIKVAWLNSSGVSKGVGVTDISTSSGDDVVARSTTSDICANSSSGVSKGVVVTRSTSDTFAATFRPGLKEVLNSVAPLR